MDTKSLNLDIITQQYRKKGAAAKGYKNLSKVISSNDNNKLKSLLRSHLDEPIRGNDLVNDRDNVDFLIDYYSILEIGIIANYFPNNLPSRLIKEVENILGNNFVNKYHSIHYPILLPQLLLKRIYSTRNEEINQIDEIKNSLFEKFLVLNQRIKSDKDVDQFLWFLDDGITGNYSINDLWNVLSNRDIIRYKLGRSNNHPLNSSLFGFIKYIQFLNDYADLLRETNEYKHLQSAFWHYQSYWFYHMKDKLSDIITIALKNIGYAMNNSSQEDLMRDQNSYIDNSRDYENWKSSSEHFTDIKKDIEYLLDSNLGEPLKNLLNHK